MRIEDQKPRRCPHCQTTLSATMLVGEGDHTPEPGDVDVCAYCAKVSLFTTYGLRVPTTAEKAELDLEPDVRRAVVMAESIILRRAL